MEEQQRIKWKERKQRKRAGLREQGYKIVEIAIPPHVVGVLERFQELTGATQSDAIVGILNSCAIEGIEKILEDWAEQSKTAIDALLEKAKTHDAQAARIAANKTDKEADHVQHTRHH